MATKPSNKTKPATAKPQASKLATATTKLLDKAGMDTAIKSIATRAKKLDGDVQLVALSAIAHLDAHGDTTFVNRLYLALGKGARKRALAEWFLAFGKVTPETDRTKAKELPFAYAKDKTTNLEGAALTPWYEFAPEPEVVTMFDVVAALHHLIQKASKAAEVNDPAVLGRLREIDDQLQAGHNVEPLVAVAAGNGETAEA